MNKNKCFLKFCILFFTFSLFSCLTMEKKRTRPGKNKDYDVKTSYKLRREAPLNKKYSEYQPFQQNQFSSSSSQGSNERLKPRNTKKLILIAHFLDKTDQYYKDINIKAANLLQAKLSESKNIFVEDSNQLYGIIRDAKPGDNSKDDLTIAKLISQNMSISSFISGKINNLDFNVQGNNIGLFRETKYYCQINLDIRIIDINIQKIIYEENVSGTSDRSVSHFFSVENKTDYQMAVIESAIQNAYEKIAWKLISKIEGIGWKGKIAKVDQNKVFINGGLKTGLAVGDILLVSDLGELIFNPDTGRPIGRAPGNIKGTIRIVDYFGKNGAIAVINSGSGFKINDYVELQ